MNPRVIQVIETDLARRGDGTAFEPIRAVRQYFNLEGELLAEADDYPPGEARHRREVERLKTMLEGISQAATRDAEEQQRTIADLSQRFRDLHRLEQLTGELQLYGKAVVRKNPRLKAKHARALGVIFRALQVEAVAEAREQMAIEASSQRKA